MLTILKRIEIWILFAIVGAGIWWAIDAENEFPPPGTFGSAAGENGSSSTSANDPNPSSEDDPASSSFLEIKKVDIQPEAVGGTILEQTLFGRSGTDEAVPLTESNLKVITSEGDNIRRFYLPFDPDPLLPSDEKSIITVKYWLKKPVETLWLTYRDQTLKVEIPPSA